MTLSDLEVIKGLLLLRHNIDTYYINDDYSRIEANNWREVNQELVALYVDLDEAIKKCKFTDSQMALLNLLMSGYDFRDVEYYVGIPAKVLRRSFNSMCRRIQQQVFDNWLVWAYDNYVRTEWKTCSKCGEQYPANTYFFYETRPECKKCYNKL